MKLRLAKPLKQRAMYSKSLLPSSPDSLTFYLANMYVWLIEPSFKVLVLFPVCCVGGLKLKINLIFLAKLELELGLILTISI